MVFLIKRGIVIGIMAISLVLFFSFADTVQAAEGALSGITIGIDAGHQLKGNNQKEPNAPGSATMKAKVTSGTQGVTSKTPEHIVNLAVALKLQKLLEESGAKVIMSRSIAEVDISNGERATMMNNENVDLCIRIHCNGSADSQVNGALFMIPVSEYTAGINDISKQYAEVILKNFIASTNAKNQGLLPSSDLTGFNWSEVPVCLVEMGFMTNVEEDKKLTNDAYQDSCAQGLYNGIAEIFGNTANKEVPNPKDITVNTIQTVIARPILPFSTIDKRSVQLNAYSIGGSGYVNPDDLGMLLNSSKSFYLQRDDRVKGFRIVPGNPIEQANQVSLMNDGLQKETILSSNIVSYHDKQIEMLSCEIDGKIYFKLVEMAQLLDICVLWNQEQGAFYIDTARFYGQAGEISSEMLMEAGFWAKANACLNFDKALLEKYQKLHVEKPEMDIQSLVKEVNMGLYRPFYTDTALITNCSDIDVLVNKYNALPADFVPKLAPVPAHYASNSQNMHPEAVDGLVKFFDAAKQNGIHLKAVSAYRSYNRQTQIYNNFLSKDSKASVDSYSARPGYSEHQTGLAVDISEVFGTHSNIGSSPRYPWIRENAHLYGFIIRYTSSGVFITGYQSEPWHLRYLGVDLATKIYQSGLTYEEYCALADKTQNSNRAGANL